MPTRTGEGFKDTRLWFVIVFTVLVKAVVILLAPLFLNAAWFTDIVGDVWMWIDFWFKAQHGGIPYVDFTREYPVGAGILYWLMSPFVHLSGNNGGMILLVHAVFMAIADVVNSALLYSILKRVLPARATGLTVLFVLAPTALLYTPVRFESYVVTSVLAGYWCHQRGKPLWATLFWSVGTWLKWFPALFIAAQEIRTLVMRRDRWQWLKSAIVFITVAVVFNLPFMFLDYQAHHNLSLWWMPYMFQSHRPISLDTVVGMVMLWIGHFPYVRYSSLWTIALMLAALLVRPGLPVEYKGVLVCIAAWIVNRVYSPQFNLWFYPFLVIVLASETGGRFWWLLGVFVALDFTNVFVYPFSFSLAQAEAHGSTALAAWRAGGGWIYAFSGAILLRASLLALLAGLLLTAPLDRSYVADERRSLGLA